jgi:hypothetical protein
MKYLHVLIFLSTALTLPAQKKYFKDEKEVQEFSIRMVQLFYDQKINELFDAVDEYSVLPKEEVEPLREKTLAAMSVVRDRFGKAIGTKKLKAERIADVALRETYLIRYENHMMRLRFVYYRNNQGWRVNTFMWDDSFGDEFEFRE